MKLCFNAKERNTVLKSLRRPGERIDDIIIMNILYLLRELRESPQLEIVDSIVIPNATRTKRLRQYLKKLIHEENHNVVLFPLFRVEHWSLLVFLPPLRGYIHFDSVDGIHRHYKSSLGRLLDKHNRYHEIVLPREMPQQESDWECGYFLLMAAYALIDMKPVHLQSEEAFRAYLARHLPSLCQNNVLRFAQKVAHIIEERYFSPI